MLVVQGGPGTGKTVVALHRAAYLLYTYRFPLEGQGVLVVGPNRLFLGYIERVLPSLGEAGVELAVLADLVDNVRVRGRDAPATARIKGDARMSRVVAKAVRDRERPLRRPLRVPYGVQTLVLPAERTAEIVADARRRFRLHNAGAPLRRVAAVRGAGRGQPVAHHPGGGPRARPAARRRSARRSSACGRCSPPPSCCTTCSARGRSSTWRPGGT